MTEHNRTELFSLAKLAQKKALTRNKKSKKNIKKPIYKSKLNLDSNSSSPSQKIGSHAEEQAIKHLCNNGLLLLERNLLCKTGEIDIAMRDQDLLVFIEVRLRNNCFFGNGLDSINKSKKLKIIRTAQYFLPYLVAKHFNYKTPTCRFDVISINQHQITWVKCAFEVVSN